MLLITNNNWFRPIARMDYVKLADNEGNFTLGVVQDFGGNTIYIKPARTGSNPAFSSPSLLPTMSFYYSGHEKKLNRWKVVGLYKTIEGLYDLYGREIPFHTASVQRITHRRSNERKLMGFADWKGALDPYTICIRATEYNGSVSNETFHVPSALRIGGNEYEEVWLW